MKQKLTNNLGLKLISVALSIVLWLIVVSIDDPVVQRTFSGIEVELLNTDAITSQGKVFEVLDGSDMISVNVSAKRSVLEKISRDHIKATADLKEMTILNSVSIDVRTTKYPDLIASITPLTKNVKLDVEDLEKKQLSISVETVGEPLEGYIVGSNSPSVNITSVSGPASVVSRIFRAVATVDVTGVSSDIRAASKVVLYDGNGDVVNTSALTVGVTDILVDVSILATKEVTLSASYSGSPAEGYAATGAISINPQTIMVAGSGSTFKSLTNIEIPGDVLPVNSAEGNVVYEVDINDYLPSGIRLASSDFDGIVTITLHVGALENTTIDVPTANISIINVPEGFDAALVDIGGSKRIEIRGLSEDLASVDVTRLTGVIDASSMTPRERIEGEQGFHAGSYDAFVKWNVPSGITVVNSSMMEVSLFVSTPVESIEGTAIDVIPEDQPLPEQ